MGKAYFTIKVTDCRKTQLRFEYQSWVFLQSELLSAKGALTGPKIIN